MKRIHVPLAAYHLTTNTNVRLPFFDEDVFSSVLANTIEETLPLKNAELIGYKINPEHLHLLVKVQYEFTVSQIMHSIKRVSATRINQILSYQLDDNPYRYLSWNQFLTIQRDIFCKKYGYSNPHEYPKFQWQIGFDDQLIRTPTQLMNTISYLRKQSVKHDIKTNAWLFIANPLPTGIRFISG
jgi:REP element-mobilizing transposase RayT